MKVYAFDSFFREIAEMEARPPRDLAELKVSLEKLLPSEGPLLFEPHCVQVLDNDDEYDFAYYIFDDEFLYAQRNKALFLLHSDWMLPDGTSGAFYEASLKLNVIKPTTSDNGTTYCAFLSGYCAGGNLEDTNGGYKIDGVRIPDLSKHLALAIPGDDFATESWPSDLLLLRSQMLVPTPSSPLSVKQAAINVIYDQNNPETWRNYYSALVEDDVESPGLYTLECALKECAKLPVDSFDWNVRWVSKEGKSLAMSCGELGKDFNAYPNNPMKSRFQITEHMVQASFHTGNWGYDWADDLYNRWIIFDDLWAACHPELANCILRYSMRWDVLS